MPWNQALDSSFPSKEEADQAIAMSEEAREESAPATETARNDEEEAEKKVSWAQVKLCKLTFCFQVEDAETEKEELQEGMEDPRLIVQSSQSAHAQKLKWKRRMVQCPCRSSKIRSRRLFSKGSILQKQSSELIRGALETQVKWKKNKTYPMFRPFNSK